MRTEQKSKKLADIFNFKKVLNLDAVNGIIGTTSRMTAFRKLKELGYYSSYSHNGKFYTLCTIPQFDANNLWEFRGIYFSGYGNLMETIQSFVKNSTTGYFALELEEILHVFVHNALGKLFVSGRLAREQIDDRYLYVSPELATDQTLARKKMMTDGYISSNTAVERLSEEQAGEHMKTFLSVLDEKQRRLFLGFESFKLGHGGDIQMARVTGINVKTVARGRKELLSKKIDSGRIRHKGAGRPPLKKTKS